MAGNTASAICIFYPLYYGTISLTSISITQVIHLLVDFVENRIVFWNYKIQNSIWIMNSSRIIEVLLYLVSHGWVGRDFPWRLGSWTEASGVYKSSRDLLKDIVRMGS